MTAGIYVRYSPGADREKTSTVEAQIEMCRQLANSKNIIVDENHIYVDQFVKKLAAITYNFDKSKIIELFDAITSDHKISLSKEQQSTIQI